MVLFVVIIGILILVIVRIRNSEIVAAKCKEELRQQEERRLAWERSPERIAELERKAIEEEENRKLQQIERERIEREKLEREEMLARDKWNVYYESKTMDEIQLMSGLEFEKFIARLLALAGYDDVALTKYTDQGGDIVCKSPCGRRTVVQVKRWNKPLGNKVIQEVFGAVKYYDAKFGMIITNSRFTQKAQELADTDKNVILCDGKWLNSMIVQHIPDKIPEFDWEIFNRDIKDKLIFSPFINTTPIRSKSRYWRTKNRYRKWRS